MSDSSSEKPLHNRENCVQYDTIPSKTTRDCGHNRVLKKWSQHFWKIQKKRLKIAGHLPQFAAQSNPKR